MPEPGKKALEAFRERLETRAEEVRRALRADMNDDRMHATSASSRGVADSGEDAVAELESHMGRIQASRHASELAAINAALDRIRDGSYGQCIDCGEPIPQARLDLDPSVARCVRCQERSERDYDERDATPSL